MFTDDDDTVKKKRKWETMWGVQGCIKYEQFEFITSWVFPTATSTDCECNKSDSNLQQLWRKNLLFSLLFSREWNFTASFSSSHLFRPLSIQYKTLHIHRTCLLFHFYSRMGCTNIRDIMIMLYRPVLRLNPLYACREGFVMLKIYFQKQCIAAQ